MLNEYLLLDGISEMRDFFRKKGRIVDIKKDDFFFRKDILCKCAGYIQKGAFRYITYTSAGKPLIVGYSFENDFVADYGSFQNRTKTIVHAQAIEDCTVFTITLDELNHYYDTCQDNHFRSRVAETLLAEIYDRLISLYCDTPEERYINLITQHPELLRMISLKEIASFIGVTPETLSRIRKNIVSNPKYSN